MQGLPSVLAFLNLSGLYAPLSSSCPHGPQVVPGLQKFLRLWNQYRDKSIGGRTAREPEMLPCCAAGIQGLLVTFGYTAV